ncbi:MAG: hypothetical protein HKP27_14230 [Myxococcales bacterium]|nr:hypothetical protein [Myxococcales bacterium]
MTTRIAALVATLCLTLLAAEAFAKGKGDWRGYLDYAYVYSSADASQLAKRLDSYAAKTGQDLESYVGQKWNPKKENDVQVIEATYRRKAIGYLLLYLARGEPRNLDRAASTIQKLSNRLGRYENRYWFHYIRAHQHLERRHQHDFVGEVLDLWFNVIVPLETPYETLQTLSLDDSPNSGFAAALPYLYENVSRMVLLRTQAKNMDDGLDPLGAMLRLLGDGRIGAYPEVIPVKASSRAYLDRILHRLEGPESDAGSLTFTFALLKAGRVHEKARRSIAQHGLEEESMAAIDAASRAYQLTYERADTEQGRCAVYTRALRQIGELYAAKQRLGVDAEVTIPFDLDGAIETYEKLHNTKKKRWEILGYARNGRKAYFEAMRGLWEEIQEATLNVADYHLTQAEADEYYAEEHARKALALYNRYLGFFNAYADGTDGKGVPDSAYFAAHEAAKGVGDAFLVYAPYPTTEEIDLATRRYQSALRIFPFDRTVWASLASALERQGREGEFTDLARPAADSVVRSSAVASWVKKRRPEAARIEKLRRSLGDSQALMYLGFAEAGDVDNLEGRLAQLRRQKAEVAKSLKELRARKARVGSVPASQTVGVGSVLDSLQSDAIDREIAGLSAASKRLDKQINARSRTLPMYREVIATDGMSDDLRSRRDHPVHKLLRAMYHEHDVE